MHLQKLNLAQLVRNNKRTKVITTVESNECDVNERDSNGSTALHISCQLNHSQILQVLLSHKDINVNLSKYENGYSPFLMACDYTCYESFCLLIRDARVDVNLCNKYGYSPFICVCLREDIRFVEVLLCFGRYVDVNKKNVYGRTALDFAKQYEREKVVSLIEEYKRDPIKTKEAIRTQLNIKSKRNQKNKQKKQKQTDSVC